jgi:EAL domain-containing protein (putative c-di-GMP-specific phosphodiesterase class I)
MGFLIAIDDFGAGYANLGHLDEIDVDIVKLDRQLFASSEVSVRGYSIFMAAIGLARALGTIVMVEGVEHAEVAASLLSRGVHYAQGFAFGEPVPLADFCAGARQPSAIPRGRVPERSPRIRAAAGRQRRVTQRRATSAHAPR